ncbi:MAG: methanogenesis marker protein 11 [Candidatus Methanosuratincola petrocarbonis]
MPGTLEELKNAVSGKRWISPHARVIVVVDERSGVAEIIEDHARGVCLGGSAWSLYHYTRNSKGVFWSKREGPRLFYKLRLSSPGSEAPAGLQASYRPASIESVELDGDLVRITYSGLAGAGVAALSRGLAEGVIDTDVKDWGGGKKVGRATITVRRKEKLIIGVDDTDRSDEGATWSLVNELALELCRRLPGVDYLEHAIVQLYPQNPHKTQNCVAVSVSFAVLPTLVETAIKTFSGMLGSETFSKETGMACFRGIQVPDAAMHFARRAKERMVTVEEAEYVATSSGFELLRVTGSRGLIGAVASIPFVEIPDEAVRLPGDCSV